MSNIKAVVYATLFGTRVCLLSDSAIGTSSGRAARKSNLQQPYKAASVDRRTTNATNLALFASCTTNSGAIREERGTLDHVGNAAKQHDEKNGRKDALVINYAVASWLVKSGSLGSFDFKDGGMFIQDPTISISERWSRLFVYLRVCFGASTHAAPQKRLRIIAKSLMRYLV